MPSYFSMFRQVLSHPANREQKLHSLCRAARWYLRRKIGAEPEEGVIFGDRRFMFYPDGLEAKTVKFFTEWCEMDVLKFLDDYLQPGDRYLDVGANVGRYVLLASRKVTPGGEITAVEPVPRNLRKLKENLDLNGLDWVEVLEYAASNEEADVALTDRDSTSSVVNEGETGGVPAKARPLDELLPHQSCDLFKLDVEGYELFALQGARALIGKGCFPVICFEHNRNYHMHGIEGDAVLELLRGAGYTLGQYRYETKELDARSELGDEVIAFNEDGEQRLLERIVGVQILR